jgi:hypothetical protein
MHPGGLINLITEKREIVNMSERYEVTYS